MEEHNFLLLFKKDRRRCAKLFSVLPASDAFDSIMLARLTYARALPLPPSSCCPLFLFLHLLLKKSSRRCDKIFSVLTSLQGPQFPCCWRDLLIRGRYRFLHRRAVFYFFLHLLFYRFRNVSVRKCLIVQLAKFLMQLISISTNSLNEMKLSLRPIISTATRQ